MQWTREHLIPIGFIALHILVCLLLLPQFKYCLEADLYSYLSIAKKYVQGDFYHAINLYWSPFFSWLLIPFELSGLPTLLVFKYLFVAFGAGIIWLFHKMLVHQQAPFFVRAAATGGVTAFCIYFSLYYSMPDIFSVFFYLLYFSWHKELFDNRKTAIISGVLGGVCFFIKAYSLPFLLLYSAVLIGAKWLIDQDLTKLQIKHFSVYLLTLLLVSSCWIIPMSIKNGGLTIGRSGAFNYHMKMSVPFQKQLDYPYEHQLLPPPNPSAISYWEDPSTMNDALEKQSKSTLGIQAFITLQNIFVLGKTVHYYNPFFFLIVIILAIRLLRGVLNRAIVFRQELITAALFIGIYPSGYLLLFINERYQWVIFIFVLYLAALLFTELASKFSLKRWDQLIAGLGFFLVTAYAPVDRLQVLHRRLAPIQKVDMAKALKIKEVIPQHARIAFDEHWGKGLVTAFVNDNQYYGIFAKNKSSVELYADIQRFQIEYVVLYLEATKTDLAPFIELISPPDFQPSVYKVK